MPSLLAEDAAALPTPREACGEEDVLAVWAGGGAWPEVCGVAVLVVSAGVTAES